MVSSVAVRYCSRTLVVKGTRARREVERAVFLVVMLDWRSLRVFGTLGMERWRKEALVVG